MERKLITQNHNPPPDKSPQPLAVGAFSPAFALTSWFRRGLVGKASPESLMRVLSYILIAFGIYLLASAGYDEFRGSTTKPATLMGKRHNTAYLYSLSVLKKNNPELFSEFMVTHLIYASLVEVAGCFLFLKSNKQDDL
jgi:hypothetical protein